MDGKANRLFAFAIFFFGRDFFLFFRGFFGDFDQAGDWVVTVLEGFEQVDR